MTSTFLLSRSVRAVSYMLALFLLCAQAYSATCTWTGGGADNKWTTAANWGGTAPRAGDNLCFAGAATASTSNDFPAGTSFSGITFNAGASAFTLAGSQITLTGNITNNSSSTQIVDVPIILSGSASTVIHSVTSPVNLGGIISEAGGARAITKTGGGKLTLSGKNTYSGGTIISSGVLHMPIFADTALGTGSVTIQQGGRLSINRVNFANNVIVNGGGIFADNGFGCSASGTFTLNSDLSIGCWAYCTFTISGAISGAYGVTLNTDCYNQHSILNLTGANTYTGKTCVQEGTLLINGSVSSPVTTASGVILGGNGSNGLAAGSTSGPSITVASGATLAPGPAMGVSVGTLRTGDVVFSSGTTYAVDLNGSASTCDQIVSTGTVNCASAALSLASITGTTYVGQEFIIVTASRVVGTFSGYPDGSIINQKGGFFRINYTDTRVKLMATPVGLLSPYNMASAIPASSTVSPAFFEGFYASNINVGVLSELGTKRYYANVPLSATTPTAVTLSGGQAW